MTLLDQIHALLTDHDVAHALIGAAALAAHGVSRSTLDQDVLVTDRRVLAATFWTTLGSQVTVDVRVGDADDPLAGMVRMTQASERDVDVIVGRHAWQADALARSLDLGPSHIPVVQVADLILLKLYAGGSQDRWDIEQLVALHTSTVSEAVDDRVTALPADCQRQWKLLRPTAR